MRDEYGNKKDYPFLEIDDGQFYKMRDEYGNKADYPTLAFVDDGLYRMRDSYGNREDHPFLVIDGFCSQAELAAILYLVGTL